MVLGYSGLKIHGGSFMWSDILQSPPAVAAIFAAILAFVSGVLGPYFQYRIGKRQAAAARRSADAAMLIVQNAGSREIARMRLDAHAATQR